jgi:hypothetical protein
MIAFAISAVLFLNFAGCAVLAGELPDPAITPGVMDVRVTQDNIGATICVPGYTKLLRPSASYISQLKKKQIALYGYEDQDAAHYEEDHLIALSIGGAATDPKNLWPQLRHGQMAAHEKDRLELVLHRMVCAGELTLERAQRAMAVNWIDAYCRNVRYP